MDNIEDAMNINLLEDIADADVEEMPLLRLPKRYIRDASNPFEFYRGKEFKRRFRFSKDAVTNGLLPKIEEALMKENNRGLPIAPVIQLLICLRFYATASFQIVCGDLFFVSQPTVSRVVFRISAMIAALMKTYIRVPAGNGNEAVTENRRLFRELGTIGNWDGLPSVDGAIDGTHIRLTNTVFQQFQEVYRNRKGYFSLNVQAVVGPRMEFLDIVPEWAGSEHDSRIFQNSRIRMKYVERHLTGILLGDSGYACQPYLLTPFRNPQTPGQERYNRAHKKTRNIVERTFGKWKRRFPCLSKGLSNKLLCSTTIVVATAVLHNLSLVIDEILPEDDEVIVEEEVPVLPVDYEPAAGFAARQALVERLYD